MVSSKFKLTTFENASLLRKMSILYFIMSIVPMSVLFYLYTELRAKGQISISENDFNITLIFVVLGVGIGFAAMRSVVLKIIDISSANRIAVEEILGPEKIKSLVSGNSNEIAILAQTFNEITSRLEENIRNLELAKKTLHSVISRVGEGISSMENIDSFLSLILETVTDALQARSGVLLFYDGEKKEFEIKSVYGKPLNMKKTIPADPSAGFLKDVIDSKQPSIVEKISREGMLNTIFSAPALAAPLILHDKILGILVVSGRRTEERFEEEEKQLLYNLSLQTAVAIENSKLNDDAEKTYFETISALAMAVEAKDPYSRGHLDRVAKYVVQIGRALNLSEKEIRTLRDSAILHDLGKIGVTDKILKKEGPLTAPEMEMMKKHCEMGESIIKPIRSLRNLCDIVRHHHEKIDGSGYPDGLKGDEIHLLVRILTVADIYDALTSKRSYRHAFNRGQAFEKLREMKDQIDQKIVEAFAKVQES